MRMPSTRALILILVILCLVGCNQIKDHPSPRTTAAAPPEPERSDPRPEPGESAKYLYLESRMRLGQNQPDQAMASLKQAIEADPESSFLRRELIRMVQKQGKKEEALELARSLARKAPHDVENLLLLVRLSKDGTGESELPGLLNQILALDPKNKETYLRLGKIYMENQQFPQALALFTRMVEQLPDYYVAHFYLGESQLLSKNPEAARNSFQRTLELEPDLVEPRFRLIEIYKQQGEKAGSKDILAAYEKILEIEPGNDRALMEMALLYHKTGQADKADYLFAELGKEAATSSRMVMVAVDTFISEKRFDDAVIIFSRMLQNAPDNDNLNFFLGMAYESSEDLPKAIEHYLKVTPAHPQYKKTILTIAFLYRDIDQGEKAVAFLEKHHEERPKDIDIISYLSSFYEGENQLEKAIEVLEKGLADAPENTALLFRLGAVQDKAGRKDDCIATMKQIIRLDPEDASALNYLGYTYADMGVKLDEAEELVLRALKLKPEDGYITDSVGWVYFQKQEYEKAVRYLERAAELSEYETIIASHLADAYVKTGQPEKALALYHRAVTNAQETDAELVRELKEKINSLENRLKQ